jgi:hypothetical protein
VGKVREAPLPSSQDPRASNPSPLSSLHRNDKQIKNLATSSDSKCINQHIKYDVEQSEEDSLHYLSWFLVISYHSAFPDPFSITYMAKNRHLY